MLFTLTNLNPSLLLWQCHQIQASASRGSEQVNHSTQSSRCQRTRVQFGASWVYHRHPSQDAPAEVRTPPASRTDWNSASEDARGTQRAQSGDPSASKSEFGLERLAAAARQSFGREGVVCSYLGLLAMKTDRVGG